MDPGCTHHRADTAPDPDCARCAELEARLASIERPADHDLLSLPRFELKAYRLLEHGWGAGWGLRPSPPRRFWMDEHPMAYQCLPLVIANQWGWQILSPVDVLVRWDGSPGADGLTVEVDPAYHVAIKSQFGRGIVTFSPPWLFRTPPGWDLYTKGPSNRSKPNCTPLEGIIETWWLPYTFTLNWKLHEPGEVVFQKGESLGQLVPVPHATFEAAAIVERPIDTEPALRDELLRWRDDRRRRQPTSARWHQRYRKADDVSGHLARVEVPAPAPPQPPATGSGEPDAPDS